jgi:transcriptional regulator with GAF, ATPase, and Fis domain
MADTTAEEPRWLRRGDERAGGAGLDLVIAWSMGEPGRVGEVTTIRGGGAVVLGRGPAAPGEREERAGFARVRPGSAGQPEPLRASTLSRRQALLRREGGGVAVERLGKLPLRVDGVALERGVLQPGSTLMLGEELLLLAREHRSIAGGAPAGFAFGAPDEHGLLGESRAVWELRDRISFAAGQRGHVLVAGPSGAGKELCARAIHRASAQAGASWVARNAATLPAGIIDAELFGNTRNYPNPGMPERIGLVGEADGGTLFLDEIGELPAELQAHLLRLLDSGEYHRLGEVKARRSQVRLIGATNRQTTSLKHDLLARFTVRIELPGLNERREDIPLLCRSILARLCSADPRLRRFCEPDGTPRVDPLFMEALLHHDYQTHVRELEELLLSSLRDSQRPYLQLTEELQARLQRVEPVATSLDRETVEAALAASGGVVAAASRLGISRHALRRLMQRHGLAL